MSTDEISSRRCKWLLEQRRFVYWQEDEIGAVLPLDDMRPDFLVDAPSTRFFLELKSVEHDTVLDQVNPSVRSFSINPMSLQKRANRLVRDAAQQLLPYASHNLPMLIMLDNYRQKGISLDKHTLGALFGEMRMQMLVDPETGRSVSECWVRVDDGSPLAGARNRHVSAVAVLEPVERFDTFEKVDDFSVPRPMKVRIVYNDDPIVRFPRDVFGEPQDEHLD